MRCPATAGTGQDSMSDAHGACREGVGLYGEIQCIMDDGHMGTHPYEQTDMTENITFLQLR